MMDIQNEFTIHDVMQALNVITKGRMVMDWSEIAKGSNPYVLMKTSNIPGKSVMEIPGLVFGDMNAPVKRIGVAMTMTECGIELASGMGLDLLVGPSSGSGCGQFRRSTLRPVPAPLQSIRH